MSGTSTTGGRADPTLDPAPPPDVEPGVVVAVEARIARMLGVGSVIAVCLLLVGVALMLAAGVPPDATDFPVFDPSRVVGDLVALRPEGFLWAGILVVVATPILRVLGEVIGFGVAGERWLAAVALGILVVIAASVGLAAALEAATTAAVATAAGA